MFRSRASLARLLAPSAVESDQDACREYKRGEENETAEGDPGTGERARRCGESGTQAACGCDGDDGEKPERAESPACIFRGRVHAYIPRWVFWVVKAIRTVRAAMTSTTMRPIVMATGRFRQNRCGLRSTNGRMIRSRKRAPPP